MPRRRVALLTNPAAGRGRSVRSAHHTAQRVLRDAGLVVRARAGRDADETRDLARAAARDALAGEVDAVVACGGDGLVSLVLPELAGTRVPLGLVPAGTGNDTARAVGLPLGDPAAAASRVAAWRPRAMDLGRVGDRWFATVLAAGFDAMVNERANQMSWPRGQMRYNLATVAELGTFVPRSYVLDLDGRTVRTRAMLVAVGNGPSFGGGLRITDGALLDDGLLDVVVIGPVGRLDLVRTYPRLFRGTHVDHPQYTRHRARRVTVAAPGIVGYADGERVGPLPLTAECVPGALTVLW